MTLSDSNILIDIMTDDQHWYRWPSAQLTRDARRYRHYFPALKIIAPENER